MIDLEPRHLRLVRSILARHVPECEVRVFGSRVSGRAARYSDLDLAILSPTPLPALRMALLRDAFSESDLPIRVDLLDAADADQGFLSRALHGAETIHSPSKEPA